MKLSRKIAMFVGVLIVVVSAALTLVSANLSSTAILKEQQSMMLEYAQESANYIDSQIQKNLAVLSEVASKDTTRSMDWATQQTALTPEIERLGYQDIAIVKPDGTAQFLSTGETADLSDRAYIQKALSGEAAISDVLISKATGEPAVAEAAPIKVNGAVVGVLVGTRDGNFLSSITDNLGSGDRGYAFVLGEDGTMFAHPNKDLVLNQSNIWADQETGGTLANLATAIETLGENKTGMANYNFDGENRMTAIYPIPNTTWTLGIGNYETDVLKGVNALKITMIIISLIVIAGGIAAAAFLGRRISKPIVNLKVLAQKVALGDVEVNTQAGSKDEVGELVTAFGEMVDNIKSQAAAAERIAAGDLELEIVPRSDRDKLAFSMIGVTQSLRSLVKEAELLTESAVEGELSARGNADQFSGGYREIIKGFNNTLDAVIQPLNVAAEYMDRIGRGDIPDTIQEEYQGDFNKIKISLNSCTNSLHGLLAAREEMSRQHDLGMIDEVMPVEQFQGAYAEMARGINTLVKSHIDVKMRVVDVVGRYAQGDLTVDMDRLPGKKALITKAVDGVKSNLIGLNQEIMMLVEAAKEGRLSTRGDASKFQYSFKDMVDGVNQTLESVTGPLFVAADYVEKISKGDIPAKITDSYNGDFNDIKNNLNTCIDAVNALVADATMLSEAAVEGKLSTRADASKHGGDFAKIVAGVNQTLDAVIAPITEASAVLQEMAKGNLQISMEGTYQGDHEAIKTAMNETLENLRSYISEIADVLAQISEGNLNLSITADYKGDFVTIKDSLNNIISSLSQVMGDINEAAEQVASGSRQVSDGSQALSQGSTEQASAIEELTASIAEIAGQTKQNAINANKANDLAVTAKENAEKGNSQMKEMLDSMVEINNSSTNISKIIKVIDDIAFQTNILALNAAVEAARAGQHGKGFAVVAEEVRNLAARSAAAARDTTDLIEGSIQKVQSGTKIANDTAAALVEIVDGIDKAANLVGGIAGASNEQASGIAQVNKGIEQVAQVVQNNSATAEESAAASEELSSQAELLKSMVSKFKINKSTIALPGILEFPDRTVPERIIQNVQSHLIHLDGGGFDKY